MSPWPDETARQVDGEVIRFMGSQTARWHGFTVFGKAVSSSFDNVSEEHGLTEDGKTVPPVIAAFCSISTSSVRFI